jgi:hypothetical protein
VLTPIAAPTFVFTPALGVDAGLFCFGFGFGFSFAKLDIRNLSFLVLVGFVDIGLKLLSDSKSRFQTKIDELKESRDAEAAHKKQKLEAILAE